MGVVHSPLILIQPARKDGSRPGFPPLPSNMSRQMEEGSQALGVGLLVGEKLGLELSELSECLNSIWFIPLHRGKNLFMDEDLPILIEGYTRIRDSLRAALDEQGRPRGAGGERLRASPSIEQYPGGELITRSRHVRLLGLLEQLDELLPFLEFARAQGLYVSQGEPPSTGEILESMQEWMGEEGEDEDLS